MKTIFTLKEDHGEDLKEITVDENNIIIDCQPSDIYRNFLTGKKIVNGFTNDNLSGTPKFGEPIYFADTPETKTYCVLKSTKGYTFEIDRVKKIVTCKICGCDDEHACVNLNEELSKNITKI